jgi:uncharacterized protein YcaQ
VKALSQAEARRIALAAQGFDARHRAAKPTWAALARTIGRLHLLQIDSVNVLVRSHYLPLFSRLGNYDRSAARQAHAGRQEPSRLRMLGP